MSSDSGEGSLQAGRPTETVETEYESSRIGLEPGSIVASRYRVLRFLNRGGAAEVYSALDQRSGSEIALKLQRADRISMRSGRRFRREAELTARLESPHLAKTLDHGIWGERFWMTFELAEASLADRLGEAPLSMEEVCLIADQILQGLEALHEAGVVHRDVKPANLLVDRDGQVRIGDFGLVRIEDGTRLTRDDAAVGTEAYMAPEQAAGRRTDARSDLYSLGLVLFEMLTGRLPQEGGSGLTLLVRRVSTPGKPISELRPDLPAWFAEFVECLLEPDPAHRFQSAGRALDVLRGKRLPSVRRRLRRAWKLAPKAKLGASLGVLLVALAAGWYWIDSQRRFSHFAERSPGEPEGIAVAVDSAGRELWEVEGSPSRYALARLQPRAPKRVVGIKSSGPATLATQGLSILDADRGNLLKTVPLPSGDWLYPQLSYTYDGVVRAEDLDGDGVDEILISYHHVPYWPSYIVLYEPSIDRSRIVFSGSGHHRFWRAVDLDHDGTKELLVVGINNRLGYTGAIAALKLDPPVNSTESRSSPLATSPDSASPAGAVDPYWYALVDASRCVRSVETGCWSVNADRSELVYQGERGEPVHLSYEGFSGSVMSPLSPVERRRARKEAYRSLKQALVTDAMRMPSEALLEIEGAVIAAEQAADPDLLSWIERAHGQLLIRVGRIAAGETVLNALLARQEHPNPDIAHEAGRTLHLQGELDRAVDWYRLALSLGDGEDTGLRRDVRLVLEDLLLAFIESKRPESALQALKDFSLAYPTHHTLTHRAYMEFLVSGSAGDVPRVESHAIDLERYWTLELRAAKGEEDSELVEAIGAALEQSSETTAPLRSLEAVALWRLGRSEEAVRSAGLARDALGPEGVLPGLGQRGKPGLLVNRAYRELVETRVRSILAP